MIQCYFGNGKGKTTASVGAAIRYLGCNKRVLYVSFLKDGTSSELQILKALPNVDVRIPPVSYHLYDNRNPEKTQIFLDAYTTFFCKILSEDSLGYDMIVLDEILDVISFGYLNTDVFIKCVKKDVDRPEFVLTGHQLSPEIAEICDYISEISSVKHPFERGVASRKGIEY